MNGRAPGVSIVAADPSVRAVAPARTDVAAFAGIAARGPLETPVRVTAFREFERTFGSFTGAGFLAYAVKGFFENGGRAAWIARAGAPPAGAAVTTAAGVHVTLAPPLPVLAGTLVAFAGTSASGDFASVVRRVVDVAGAVLVLDAPLTGADPHEDPALDLTRPVVASTGAVAAQGTLRSGAGAVAARVAAASPGAWGNALAVRVMHEAIVQTSAVESASNDASAFAVASVARIARGSVVRLRQGTTLDAYRAVADVDPVRRTIRIHSTDPAQALRGALNQPLPSAPVLGGGHPPLVVDVLALRVLVLENGTVVEDYDPVSPVALDDFAVRLANAGSRITLDTASGAPATLDPATWLADVSARELGAGTDGVRMLSAHDLLRALAAFAPLREPTLIAVPDSCAIGEPVAPPPAPQPPPPVECTDRRWFTSSNVVNAAAPDETPAPRARTEDGPVIDADASALVATRLVEFCELGAIPNDDLPPHPSFRFALVDVPRDADPLAYRALFDAARAAIHWPWTGVYDPLARDGALRFVPPSGHVAGAFAATDLALGVHHSAANSELRWVASVARDVDADLQAVYNDAQVNCIRALPNRGIRIYGARTLASSGDWLYVPVRRLVSMIESALLGAMQWAVFEPNNPTLRQLVRRSCATLLDTLWQAGAFAGASQEDAFYVTCDGTNNPPAAQAKGELIVDIGVAPVRPAEFIVFRVGHQHDVLEVFEGAAA